MFTAGRRMLFASSMVLLLTLGGVSSNGLLRQQQDETRQAQFEEKLRTKMDYKCEGQSLRTALVGLLDQAKMDYMVMMPVGTGGDITFSATNAPLEGIIVSILRSVSTPALDYRFENELLNVKLKGRGQAAQMACWVRMKDVPIRPAMRSVVQGIGANMVLDNSIQGNVSVTLDGVTPQAALAAITKAVGKDLTMRIEDNVYTFVGKMNH